MYQYTLCKDCDLVVKVLLSRFYNLWLQSSSDDEASDIRVVLHHLYSNRELFKKFARYLEFSEDCPDLFDRFDKMQSDIFDGLIE